MLDGRRPLQRHGACAQRGRAGGLSPDRLRGRRVMVLGDLVADQFLYGEIARVSREAPVLILRHKRTETVPGGAANCVMNLATLGARAGIVGVLGEDESGGALLRRL